jgi:hypothetical protein
MLAGWPESVDASPVVAHSTQATAPKATAAPSTTGETPGAGWGEASDLYIAVSSFYGW